MKATRILAGAILVSGLWAGASRAQAPAVPADAAAAAADKPGFCEKIEMGIDRKRRKMCEKPIGQMLNAITKPFSAATGGIIPGFCPGTPSEEDLKKPGAAGAAAQAMKDAAEAAERRRAVRILGTFDCHWHPEAELGLAAALRTDRAECVRLEAAIALNRGCCCTKLIVQALEDCVSGMDKFGPSENSPRVVMVAQMALEKCLQCPEAIMIEEPLPDDTDRRMEEDRGSDRLPNPRNANDPGSAKPLNPPPPPPAAPPGTIPSFGPTARGSGKPSRELIEKAKRTLAMAQAKNPVVEERLPSGQRSIAGLANYVMSGPQTAAPVMSRQTSAPAEAVAARPSAPPATITRAPAPQAAPSPTVARAPIQQMQPVAPLNVEVRSPAFARPAATPPAMLQPPAAAPITASSYRTVPVTPEPVKPVRTIDPVVLKCLETLRDAQDPEVRHGAVRTLVALNWREHPEAISGLIYAARNDKHAGMRVACIRALAAMKAGTPEVMTGLKPMANDDDAWIRQETLQALSYLQTFLPPQTASLQSPRTSR